MLICDASFFTFVGYERCGVGVAHELYPEDLKTVLDMIGGYRYRDPKTLGGGCSRIHGGMYTAASSSMYTSPLSALSGYNYALWFCWGLYLTKQ